MGSTEKIQSAIREGLDMSVSGALHDTTRDIKTTIETSSKETSELSKKLVFWTKVMAFAIIGQIIAVVGQIIVAIILANST